MTYDQTRDNEQLSYLDDAISKFLSRHNSNFQGTNRRTIIFFPGGIGSRLLRASTPEPDGPPFSYNTVWLDGSIAINAAYDLQMQGDIDYKKQIIVANGALDIPLCLTPYDNFTTWCDASGIDYLIYGWDWRRNPDRIVDYFLKVFMPYFKDAVRECYPNPLRHLSLVGHSYGGIIIKLIFNRSDDPYVQLFKQGVTVATPFYGYGGQLARYFVGEPDLYFRYSKSDLVRIISSLAGGYPLMFLDEDTFQRNRVALANDSDFPLPYYPVLDATDGTMADPYNPGTSDGNVRYPQNYGFDPFELACGKLICQQVAAPLVPAINKKFVNIRGVTTESNNVVNDTVNNQTWDWIAPDFNPDTGNSPITDYLGPGDGTLPAWSTRLISTPNVYTVLGDDVDHMSLMDNNQVRNRLAAVI
jgi:hypothetical protein